VYFATFTGNTLLNTAIAPGIRIGFIVTPQNLIEQLTRLRRMTGRQGVSRLTKR
jgi:DNA-binding transcriptional MocR family regulator